MAAQHPASHSAPLAPQERDALAAFILDEIINVGVEDEIDSDLKDRARTALRKAGYTIYEEIRRG